MFKKETTVEDYITLVLTHKCTRNCYFCIDKYRNKLDKEMSLDVVANAIKYAQENNVKTIALLGGEPTLHKDIIQIVEMIKDANIKVLVTSNFDNIDIIRELDGKVDYFNYSIYDEDIFTQHYDFIKEMKSDITLSKLLHDVNEEYLYRLINRGEELNCSVKFSSTVGVSENLDWLDNIVDDEFILFEEIVGQSIGNCIIKRYDKPFINNNAKQSIKFLVDGSSGTTWDIT